MSSDLLFGKTFKKRILTPELMDDLDLDQTRHEKALHGLERINAISFAAHSLWPILKHYYHSHAQMPLCVLDIASGGGDLTRQLARRAARENLPFIFEGGDFNPRAVAYASKLAQQSRLPVEYFIFDALKDSVPERFNVVISTLFLHHLKENQIAPFFENLSRSQARLIAVADLERSRRGWLLAFLATRLFSRSPIVHIDGPLSVKASLTRGEALSAARAAGFKHAEARPIWPLRYLLTCQR